MSTWSWQHGLLVAGALALLAGIIAVIADEYVHVRRMRTSNQQHYVPPQRRDFK